MSKFIGEAGEIEAMQFTLDEKDRVFNFIKGWKTPTWDGNGNPCIDIHTPEGTKRVSIGDYVIRDANGEFFPCELDVFERNYKSVNA